MTALFRNSPRPICQCKRYFSISLPKNVSLQWDKNDQEALADTLPPYPYGPARWYKQSRLGLYGGQRIQFGNNVSEKHDTKTRRTWHPNIFTRKLFSRSLNRTVQIRVTTRVLRTIDKLGGLDEYLLGEKAARIKELGESGWWLRWAIMQTPTIKNRFAEERERLGLPPKILTDANASAEKIAEAVRKAEGALTDSPLQPEKKENQPRLKFRVGPGKHIMLTPNGWRRTRPDPAYFRNKLKENIANKKYPEFVNKKVEDFKSRLEALQEKASKDSIQPQITDAEKTMMVRKARRALRKRLEMRLERHVVKRERRKEYKKQERQRRKSADAQNMRK